MARVFRIEGDRKEIRERERRAKDPRERERLQAIRMGMSGNYTMEEIAEAVGRARSAVGRWAGWYRERGIDGLLERSKPPGNKPAINEKIRKELEAGLSEGRWKRGKEIRAWLAGHHGIEMSIHGVYYWLGKVGGVLKVPRKTHVRKDAVAAAAFKVELAQRLEKLGVPREAKVRVWMVDEHRYGLISVLRKVWTLRGHKPTAPYQTKYQWGHLYAALEVEGENSAEFFFSPTVSLEVSDFFLRQLAETDENAHHIVIWDGAGFHQKPGLHPIPERVHLLQLPAYSPELNPVEKLFDQLKDAIGNHIFDTLDDIEASIVSLLSTFWENAKIVSSLIGRGWLQSQTNSSSPILRPVLNWSWYQAFSIMAEAVGLAAPVSLRSARTAFSSHWNFSRRRWRKMAEGVGLPTRRRPAVWLCG